MTARFASASFLMAAIFSSAAFAASAASPFSAARTVILGGLLYAAGLLFGVQQRAEDNHVGLRFGAQLLFELLKLAPGAFGLGGGLSVVFGVFGQAGPPPAKEF